MKRLVCIAFLAAACGGNNHQSLCDNQVPPPVACMQTCDPQPGAPNSCPAGYHCSPDGKCDAECTVGGGQCGDGYVCTTDGYCQGDNGSNTPPVDVNCPAVHVMAMPTTPSIELLLDRSGSMDNTDIAPTRFQALVNGLFGTSGAITTTQTKAYFGAAMFAGDQSPCLNLNGFTAPRALNNATALDTLVTNHPPNGGSTPTAPAIDQVVADFMTNPPPAGSPPVILLATDGEPNSCSGSTTGANAASVTAATNAYAKGIRLFIVGLAGLNTTFLQQMANAGAGVQAGQPDAPFFVANNPTQLVTAFNQIIGGVLSCDLMTNGHVDPTTAMGGTVIVDGMVLTYGTDWTIDPNGMIIHILGQACTNLKNSANPSVDASFPCGSVIF